MEKSSQKSLCSEITPVSLPCESRPLPGLPVRTRRVRTSARRRPGGTGRRGNEVHRTEPAHLPHQIRHGPGAFRGKGRIDAFQPPAATPPALPPPERPAPQPLKDGGHLEATLATVLKYRHIATTPRAPARITGSPRHCSKTTEPARADIDPDPVRHPPHRPGKDAAPLGEPEGDAILINQTVIHMIIHMIRLL